MDYQGSNVREFLQTNGRVVLERVYNNYSLKSFTQKDIEDITNGYRFLLGEGAFGKVYKGRLLDNQRPVAVKRYKNGTKKEEFAKELIVHSQTNHKNVVRLLGCCTEEDALMIVMEFICNGNLYNILHCCNANGFVPFPLDKRLDIAIESAEALSSMHSMYSPVLHGDIKPANILLDENLRPKISDFGIARLLSADEAQHTRNVIGCIGYMDPLFCQSGILTPKSDVYSFGVVLLEMLTRKKAAGGDTNLTQSFIEALRKWKKVRQMYDEEIASEKRDIKLLDGIAKLTAECLKLEDKKRPDMVEVADTLRTIRKVLHKRKGRSSTGANSVVHNESGNAEDVLSPAPISVNATDKIPPSALVSTISMDELKEITRNFSNDTLIGVGSYSKVFFGVLKDGQKSAIKKLDPGVAEKKKFEPVKEILFEVPVVSRFKHENVVQLLGYCDNGEIRAIAYEYAPRGSLHDILHGKNDVMGAQPGPVLSWAQRVKIALSAANGLEFLHEKARPCIIHRNIKSSNILIFDGDVAKIGGLGVSKQAPEYIRNSIFLDRMPLRPVYGPDRAPEHETTTKSDVYNFGVVLLELITGRKAVGRPQRVDPALPLVNFVAWASTRLSESMVHTCVDPRLGGDYPPKALAKMAEIAALCVQREMEFRPNMSIVVKALRLSSKFPSAAEASRA